jgi:hypothetical protein
LAQAGILLATERANRRPGVRQRIEIAFASLKRVFGLGETLATTFVGLATRIATKITAYTYAFLVNRMFWVVLKVTSRSYGRDPDNTHLGELHHQQTRVLQHTDENLYNRRSMMHAAVHGRISCSGARYPGGYCLLPHELMGFFCYGMVALHVWSSSFEESEAVV